MMFARLPRWVSGGGALLAFVAGIVNASGFLGLRHQGITHLTGTTTLLGLAAGDADIDALLHLAALIGAFVAGCVASGMIVQDSTLRLGRRYGVVLVLEGILLAAAAPLLARGLVSGEYLASAACGLQNAMASTYSGAVLRTTHVSGSLTDLGIFLGHRLRGLPVDARRVRLLLTLVSSFFAGAVAGTLLFRRIGYASLYVPAVMTIVVGSAYGAYRHWRMRRDAA